MGFSRESKASIESGRDDSIAQVLDGRYRLERVIGHGSSAVVYRAVDLRLERTVAVKVFRASTADPRVLARQRAEIACLVTVSDPGLVALLDGRICGFDRRADRADRGPGRTPPDISYLVTEFVDGTSLDERLRTSTMTLEDAARIGLQVAAALAAAHHAGIVHRDVKPENILITASGEAKLADFGIAHLMNTAHLTLTGEVLGTPLYLSPEQASGGDVGPATDVYSLGLVLLECLTGAAEYPGSAAQSAMTRLARNPRLPAHLPASWTDLLGAMTSPSPHDRPTTKAVAAALRAELEERSRRRLATTITSPTAAPPPVPLARDREYPDPASRTTPRPARRRSRAGLIAVGGIALSVLAPLVVITVVHHLESRAAFTPNAPSQRAESLHAAGATATSARPAVSTADTQQTGPADAPAARPVVQMRLITSTATTTITAVLTLTAPAPVAATTVTTVTTVTTTATAPSGEGVVPVTTSDDSSTTPSDPSTTTTPQTAPTTGAGIAAIGHPTAPAADTPHAAG